MYMPFPFQIFQTPDYIGMTFEYGPAYRTIYTNGSPHLQGPLNFWMGDSRGHWEADTLVVDQGVRERHPRCSGAHRT